MCEPCFSFLFLFFCLFLVISNRIAGSETVAPHTYFRSCGSNFCGGKILDHEERYVFTILFFPGLGRGLDPEWRWLSVTCNFLLMKKKKTCDFACSVFLLSDTSWELCLSAGRTVSCQSCLPVTKGKCNALSWVAQSCFTGLIASLI